MSVTDKFMCSGRPYDPPAQDQDAVAVLMSGGTDSSVTAAKLKASGRPVVGVTMLIPSALGPNCGGAQLRACCGQGASQVAHDLGIPHYFVDVREEFQSRIIDRFRDEYRQGRTPSPCIDCNTFIKFGVVMDLIRDGLGIERVATGHYARIAMAEGGPRLFAVPHRKDQSYFLYGIRRDRLHRITFPLAGQAKPETRREARRLSLHADRSESVDLCFAGQDDYRAALGPDPDEGPGDVLDLDGKVIGRHEGIAKYTWGQRSGLGIAAGVPLYIVDIDPAHNTITLGGREAASRREVHTENANILAPELLDVDRPLHGKIRAYHEARPCRITELTDSRMTVRFDTPHHGVAPGQHLVLYGDTGQVLAGGEIARPRL